MNYCIECKHCVDPYNRPFTMALYESGFTAFCDAVKDPVFMKNAECQKQREGPTTDTNCGSSGYYWMARE